VRDGPAAGDGIHNRIVHGSCFRRAGNNARDQGTQDGILGEMLPLNKAEKWMRRAIDGLERTGERRDFLEIIGREYADAGRNQVSH